MLSCTETSPSRSQLLGDVSFTVHTFRVTKSMSCKKVEVVGATWGRFRHGNTFRVTKSMSCKKVEVVGATWGRFRTRTYF